ncbi:hypothetical protein BC940DRAFT_165693 [Gongronella butleri]|nr:hypothetical protein BC940DRAFT_165693 [Gongronella butleri]
MDLQNFDPACLDEMEHVFPTLGGVVTVKNAGYYLSLLDQFVKLRKSFHGHLDAFHARAELRYIQWIHGCKERPANLTNIVPPLDVAYMFHVHLLSPYRFYEDSQRMMVPYMLSIPMPMEQLYMQRDKPNSASVQFWEQRCAEGNEPFTLTVDDLTQPVPSYRKCPFCKKGFKINSADYGSWRVDAMTLLRCWYYQPAWLRGTLLNNTGNIRRILMTERPSNPVVGLWIKVWPNNTSDSGAPPTGSAAIREFIRTRVFHQTRSMFEIEPILIRQLHFHALDQGWTEAEERQKRERLQDLTTCINACYSNNPSPFSLDLIQAADQQYRRTLALLEHEWIYPDAIVRGIRHYPNFLKLFAQPQFELTALPPIHTEIIWRMHLMFPRQYRELTLRAVHRVVNYEDNIRKYPVEREKAGGLLHLPGHHPSTSRVHPHPDPVTQMDFVQGSAHVYDPIDEDDPRDGSITDTKDSNSTTGARCYSGSHSSSSHRQPSRSSSFFDTASEASSGLL